MTFDDVRELGLKLPGATETRYYRMPALEVKNEIFVVQTSHPSAEPNSIASLSVLSGATNLSPRNRQFFTCDLIMNLTRWHSYDWMS